MSQGKKPTILLIEAETSLRRLITLGLQHRGMHVIEASSLASVPSIEAQQPDLLVLDVHSRATSDWSFLNAIQTHPQLSSLPKVVLAWDCQPSEDANQATTTAAQTQIMCLTKPFDARTLYGTIEQVLAANAAQEVAAEARAEEILLASYSAHPAPSIWPIVTAAGLLLAVIGMLFQVVIVAMGMLIAIVALLLWTLGTGSQQGRAALY